jgi:hypothetical protein
MKPRKPFLLRISPELYAALEAWAQQELRSVNGQIEYVLQEAVRKRGQRFPERSKGSAADLDPPLDTKVDVKEKGERGKRGRQD